MSFRLGFLSLSLALSCTIACGGSSGSGDPTTPAPSPSGSGVGSSGAPADPNAPSASSSSSSSSSGAAATGPKVSIQMRGTTAPFTFQDAWSGETPKQQIVAIHSLYLLRSATDPNPVQVFDHGASAVEAELISGKAIEVGSVVAKTLPAGVFTMAKAGASYVRYAVAARMHSTIAVDGEYDNVQALSDGAVIDGVTHKKGYFRYSFAAGGVTYGTLEGENAPTPIATTTGGLTMDMSGPETFYVFPANISIDPNIAADREVMLELNVNNSFRWQDQTADGYTTGVFDTTPSTYEPVMAFGANSFKLTMGPVGAE